MWILSVIFEAVQPVKSIREFVARLLLPRISIVIIPLSFAVGLIFHFISVNMGYEELDLSTESFLWNGLIIVFGLFFYTRYLKRN